MARQKRNLQNHHPHLDQDNYAETAKKLVIVNAPSVFTAVWNMVKGFFDPGVVAKMVFASAGEETERTLLEYLPASSIPKELRTPRDEGDGVDGGPAKNWPMPRGERFPPSCRGGSVPKEYLAGIGAAMSTTGVSARSNGYVALPSASPGEFLSVQAFEAYDYDFRLVLGLADESDGQQLGEEICRSELGTSCASTVVVPGDVSERRNLVAVFENAHSMFRSK